MNRQVDTDTVTQLQQLEIEDWRREQDRELVITAEAY